ncbi:MAG: TfoX/Sxy family protein [Rhodobacteraceae bacterium]|nr:TfoX/Sxy family protein [Paracoccaceae bacterium]
MTPPPPQTPVTAVRNIGPAMAETLARVGVTTAEDLRRLGADAVYARLLAQGTRPHFIAYYAIEMGLQGRPWTDCTGPEKEALRQRFDALKAASKAGGAHDKGRTRLDAALAEIGVIDAARRQPTSSRPEKK